MNIRLFSYNSLMQMLILLVISTTSYAQTQTIPSTVDPSRIEKQLSQPPAPGLPPLQAPERPVVESNPAPAGADQYFFVLKHLVVEGSTAYQAESLESLAAGLVGKEISVADLYQIAAQITQRYHADGYVLSRAVVPQQEITDGIARITVVEGYIQDVVLSGDGLPGYPADKIIEKIKTAHPLNIHQLEHELLILGDLPGLSARAVLEPLEQEEASKVPGGIRLNIIFSQQVRQSLVSLDNDGSKFVGPWLARLHTDMVHTAPFLGQTSLTLAAAPHLKELAYFSLSESAPVSANGLRLTGAMKFSRSEPGSTLSQLDLYSRYQSLGVGLEYPLILTREDRLDVFSNFEANNILSNILASRLYDDRLRIIRVGGRYWVNDRWGGASFANLVFSQGLDILGSRKTGSRDLSRAEGHSDFSKIEASITHLHPIARDFSLRTTLAGQYGFVPLLSSEQYGYGGAQMGRAYDNAEITGDSGIALSAEISYQGFAHGTSPSVKPFLFYDIGKVWNRESGEGGLSGASAGGGLRLWLGPVHLAVTVAEPLTRPVSNPVSGNGKSPRYLLSAEIPF